MNVRFFDPAKAYLRIKAEIDGVMQDVLERGDLILRKDVEDFEKNLAIYVGAKYAVAVASGTDALILSLIAAGIKPGDEVMVSSYTFRATVEAVHHVGAIPVLYDLDGEIKIGPKTKAVIACHIAGEVNMTPGFAETLKSQGVQLIEDACQAIGAAPIQGVTACYSFYPAKILGCYGDGGAIATNDPAIADELRKLRNHYKGDWSKYAYNSRLDNIQAAVLNVKIKYLPEDINRRKEIAETYDRLLKGVGLPKVRTVYQDYIITHPKRDELKSFLSGAGIETLENTYPFPEGLEKGTWTKAYEAMSLRIPCNPDLTDEEVAYVVGKINEYAANTL